MKICYDAHKNQTDESGVPYVFHPIHLAEYMDTEFETCAALLHDVPEDTDWTLEDLEEAFIFPVFSSCSKLEEFPEGLQLDLEKIGIIQKRL